jgi:ABC-type sugar transport system substrate-binding protein
MKSSIRSLYPALLALVMAASAACAPAPIASTPASAPTAASAAAPATASTSAKQLTFGVVHNNADHPSITAMSQGMQDEAAVYGVKLVMLDPAFDPQKQATMIDNLITQKVDALLINAVDPAAVVPSLKKAKDAKIPVIMHNADTNDEGRKYSETFVTTDTYAQGFAVGQAMTAVMQPGSKMAVISGKPGQSGVAERIQGAKDATKDLKLQWVAEQPAEWSKDKALTVMQDFLTRYPDLNGVFALDDPMALGALQAIKAANKSSIKVFGVNGNKEACDAIASGDMGGTALQLSYLVGVYAVRAGWDVTHARLVQKVISAPTVGLTKNNLEQWQKQCW